MSAILQEDSQNEIFNKINNSATIILGMNNFLKLRFQNETDERASFCFNMMQDAVEDLQAMIKTLYSINNKAEVKEPQVLVESIPNVLK